MREDKRHDRQAASPAALVVFLQILAWVTANIGVLGALLLALLPQEPSAGATSMDMVFRLGGAGLLLLACLAVAAMLWAVSSLVRRQHESLLVQRQIAWALEQRIAEAAEPSPPGDHAREEALLRQVVSELAEINRALLMSETQREVRRRERQRLLADKLAAEIDAAISREDMESAQVLVDRLGEDAPDDPRSPQLRDHVAAVKASFDARDIDRETRRVHELMAAAGFDMAAVVARDLAHKHPSPETRQLLEHVQREAAAFYNERRRALYTQIDRYAQDRQWRAALAAANQLLKDYPDSPQGQAIALQLPTLQDNARLEEVRVMRDRVRDLIERRQFAQAVQAAREIIVRYHGTAAAEELTHQLPRLEELARSQGEVSDKRQANSE